MFIVSYLIGTPRRAATKTAPFLLQGGAGLSVDEGRWPDSCWILNIRVPRHLRGQVHRTPQDDGNMANLFVENGDRPRSEPGERR